MLCSAEDIKVPFINDIFKLPFATFIDDYLHKWKFYYQIEPVKNQMEERKKKPFQIVLQT